MNYKSKNRKLQSLVSYKPVIVIDYPRFIPKTISGFKISVTVVSVV